MTNCYCRKTRRKRRLEGFALKVNYNNTLFVSDIGPPLISDDEHGRRVVKTRIFYCAPFCRAVAAGLQSTKLNRAIIIRAKVRFAGKSLKTLSSSSRETNVSLDALLSEPYGTYSFFFFLFISSEAENARAPRTRDPFRRGGIIFPFFVHAIGRTDRTRWSYYKNTSERFL